jgi:hypothetical protein
MEHVVSVRVPSEWQGRVTSDRLRAWVLDWLRQPVQFNRVPAPGRYKLSIRFTQGEYAALKKLRRRSMSSTIRGIGALNIPPPPEGTRGKLLNGVLGAASLLIFLFARSKK